MNSTRKNSTRFFLGFIILLVLIVSGLLGIMHFYGDEIKQSVIRQLNERMEIEISVEEIQLDLFTHFPRGSLRLRGINSQGKNSSAGKSLLKAGEIDLLFNLFDIFREDYKIEKINIYDAFLNLSVSEDGEPNYKIFKNNRGSGNSLSVNLKKVHFKNVVISYIHLPSLQEYLFRVDAGDLKGTFSNLSQQFQFDGQIYSSHIKSGNYSFLTDRALSIDTEIVIDTDQHILRFSKGDVHSEGLDFKVTGSVITKENNKHLTLVLLVDRSSVESLVKIIPPIYLQPMHDVTLDGELTLSANIYGNFSGNLIPRVDIDFELEDGEFIHKKSGLKLSSLKFDGNFTTGEAASEKTYQLSINNISSLMEGGTIGGSIEIFNFNQPRIHTRLISVLGMEHLASVFQIDTLEHVTGLMELNLEFRNQLRDFKKFTIGDFISSQTTGSMKISNMNFNLKKSPLDFHDFNGIFKFSNKDLKIDEFSGFVSGSDFFMKGYFRNALAYAFVPGEPIYITADFHSNRFNLDRILETGKDKDSENMHLSFSDRVNYDLNIEIDTFTFRKFSSTNNVGELTQQNRTLYVRNTRLNSMDGMVKIDGSISGRNDHLYTINCQAEFKGVNIHKLFRDFGDFGQQNITSEHLRGNVDAIVKYTSTMTPYLFVDQKSVFTLADVEIYNGELIRYQPLRKLSKYMREGELDHVKFSTLKNKIKIENEVVFIPQMDIESSSMNLSLYGEHTFDNEIDYHVQLLLSELISRKEVIEEDLGNNFVEDDGLGRTRLYLTMTGSAEDPVVKLDSREVRNKISADLRQERAELRELFREEFGLEKKNTQAGDDELSGNPQKNKQFLIEWEEIKDSKVTDKIQGKDTQVQKKENSGEKDFIIRWDESKDTIDREDFREKK